MQTIEIDDFAPITTDNYMTIDLASNPSDDVPLPRAVRDPHKEIKGYSEAYNAAMTAQQGANALRQAHAEKLEAVRQIDLAHMDLVAKAKAGETIKPGSAYEIQVARASAEADVSLAAEAIASADEDAARAKDRIKHVLRAELQRFLMRLQETEAETAKKAAAAKREANIAATHANRIFVALSLNGTTLTAEDAAILLGLNG